MDELALSLQSYTPNKPISFNVDDTSQKNDLGFCMAVGKVCSDDGGEDQATNSSSDPPLQLHLLPFSPLHRSNNFPNFTCLTQNLLSEEGPTHSSSPNSAVSSFQMEITAERRVICRGSDEEAENYCSARKKLRLSKQQSAFLEDSFKQHTTLNPKEKVALAKRLNLQPRQVEVWFQNRRARKKLKQTEVDCEYLNKCSETLREENRRLQKELQELRPLINASNMHIPATTLTMCPSCQRLDAGVTIVPNH